MKNIEKQAEHLFTFKNQMDTVSESIKNIQKLLRDMCVAFPIKFECDRMEDAIPTGEGQYQLSHMIENLLWEEIKKGSHSEWTLFYEKQEQKGYFDIYEADVTGEPRVFEPAKTILKKRLIEMDLGTRKKMFHFLERFLDEVCKLCKINEFQSTYSGIQKKMEKMSTSTISRVASDFAPAISQVKE